MNEKRIYVVVAGTVHIPEIKPRLYIKQPAGRQIAQACHVVSKLRGLLGDYEDITTIILQGRDTAELRHVQGLLIKKKLFVVQFYDSNIDAYGPGEVLTAIAVYAVPKKVEQILNYLPLWR